MLSDPQVWLSLLTLTVLEVVLSIDNLVVIAVLVGKLPKARQAQARYIGMTLALIPRLVLLFFIGWIIGLTEPLFELFGHGVSGKDLILAAGGLFLIYKATQEIHGALEGDEGEASARVLLAPQVAAPTCRVPSPKRHKSGAALTAAISRCGGASWSMPSSSHRAGR